MMTTTPGATPTKTFDFLSPSGDDICVVCGTDVKQAYKNPCDRKLRLWGGDGSKTNICPQTDFKMVEWLRIICEKT